MDGHLFQNCDTIYVRFFPRILAIIPATRYTCVFFATYTCVLSCFVGFVFPSTGPFSYKRAYICAKKAHIYVLQTSMWKWGYRKSSYKRHIRTPYKHVLFITCICHITAGRSRYFSSAWHLRNNMPCMCGIIYERKITICRSLFRPERCFLMQSRWVLSLDSLFIM